MNRDSRPAVRQIGLFTFITPAKPVKRGRTQAQRDREDAAMISRRQANANLYEPMSNALKQLTGGFTRQDLLVLTSRLCSEKGLRIDRGAIHQKTCLVCWFCEHFSELAHQPDPSHDFDPFDLFQDSEPMPIIWF